MNLGYESGDQVAAFDEQKQKSKISCKCTFKFNKLYFVFCDAVLQSLEPESVACQPDVPPSKPPSWLKPFSNS